MPDAYNATAGTAPPLAEKLNDARDFLNNHKVVLLTTRAANGQLHARTMAIAEITPDWKIRFLYDNESYKEKEVENDNHVNIAVDGSSSNNGWISIAGRASRTNEEGLTAKLYNPTIKAWFGDRGDGVHTGEPSDPRITVLEVKVDLIRHFYQKRTAVGTAVDVISSAISGDVARPGEIREVKGEEIQAAASKGELK